MYRLSKDGESISTFHQLCDNKGPIITLFEKSDGAVVGFYSPLSFDSTYGNFKEDMNTFIFNLDNQTKFEKIKKVDQSSAKKLLAHMYHILEYRL